MRPLLIACVAMAAVARNVFGAEPLSSPDAAAPSLCQLVKALRPDLEVGSMASGLAPSAADREPLAAFFRHNFSIMTVGVYMMSNQRNPGPVSFTTTDPLVEFAAANHIAVYLHPLIGGAEYNPRWLNEGSHTKQELQTIMRDRIASILTRYRGRLAYADVVNEALSGSGRDAQGQFTWITVVRGGEHVWMKQLGMYQGKKYAFPQYLVDAFRIAREAGGPGLKLILNEYDNGTTRSRRGVVFLELCQALREEGIPLDGAGLQLHCRLKQGKLVEWGNVPFDFDAFAAMLKRYEEAGIEVHITEFDIHLPPDPTAQDYELQGQFYAEVLKHAVRSPAVKTFKTWGFCDKYSWKENGVDGHPLMLGYDLQPKPAYTRQIEMLKSLAASPGVSQ